MKQSVILFLLLIFAIYSYSQAITTSAISGSPFCAGVSFNIHYDITGTFTSGNIFTAQLSAANGSFTSSIIIGSVPTTFGGNITITIPNNLASGAFYRVRVVASLPVVIGTDNGNDLVFKEIDLNAPTFTGTVFCPGASIPLSYSLVDCDFISGNTFTAQLSDATGSFASPTLLQSSTTTQAGSILITIPTSTPSGTLYRIRLVASIPNRISPDNGVNLTMSSYGIDAPIFSGTSFCQGEPLTIQYTIQNGCSFPFLPSSNIFSAQLSTASGSFISPIDIGSVTSTNSGYIQATIPLGLSAGSGYRIRVVSSNPSVIASANNGVNLIVSAAVGTPATFGTSAWNAYAYAGTASPITSNTFLGTYTENNLSFDTKNRWDAAIGPGAANASSGSSYQGCPTAGTNYSVSFKRTNFLCGYYRFDIPVQDDGLTLFINNVQVFQNINYSPNLQNNIWTGFLGPTSTVEFQLKNITGVGQLQVNLNAALNPLIISEPAFMCSATSTILSTSSDISLSYSWTPTSSLTPANGIGANVVASPLSTTTYTVKGTDATTGCFVARDLLVTVIGATIIPSISIDNVASSICSGVTEAKLTVTGANTYTWSPASGLNTTIGSGVVANPTSTTTYTVTGSTGCQSASSSTTVIVQPIPINPASIFGDKTWNVYCHNNTTLSNYYGYYTENNLNINTASRWASGSGPTVANSSSGLAYTGCNFGSTNYSMSFKRTNFTCGYYQIDIPFQDDAVKLLINGVQVFQNFNYTPGFQPNVWTGFLGPSTTIEIQFINYQLAGQLAVSIIPSTSLPQVLNTNTNICVGTAANLSATSSIAGVTYTWSVVDPSSTLSFLPNAAIANPLLQSTVATPPSDYLVTNVLNDAAGTGCTSSTTFSVSVSLLPNTVVSPISSISVVTACTNFGVTLTVKGANTYTWSPSIGLSVTTGFSVIAKPLVTTTYTVTGSNNCSSNSVDATVIVSPLPAPNTFPTGFWNVYGFNSSTIGTNYQGFYTGNGFGTTGLNFDTRTRWSSNDVPSNANASNGKVWQGCSMNTINSSMSFKRAGFPCAVYQLNVPSHADDFILYIDGIEVAKHNGCCDEHVNLWTGTLNANSTVEWQLFRNSNESYLQVSFEVVPLPVTTIFPTSTWNAYGFNSTVLGTNYLGYYTDNGAGTTGLDFDTRTRWLGTDVPSNANSSTGINWQGCAMNATNASLSFKRSGFSCGVYQLDVPSHADGFLLFINGIQVAQHNACCDSHINLWTGILDSTSTIEWQLFRNLNESYLEVVFKKIAQPTGQTLWLGGVSNDWLNDSNWCNGIPTNSTDVLIHAAGVKNMPVINGAGAVAKNITISPAIIGGSYSNSIPAASLSVNNSLDVYGNWTNNGVFNSNTSTINFVGSGNNNTITSSGAETFNNITFNKLNGIAVSTGTQQISGAITFVNGIVKQNSTFIINNGGSASGASNKSYVDGELTKVGNSAFVFPTGKAGFYRPISISAPTSASDAFTAQYFNTNPDISYPGEQRAEILDHISNAEYWILNKNTGASNVNVALSWGSNSEAITDINLLRVAAWDGTIWTDQGNGGVIETLTSLTILTASPSIIYGPYALAEQKLPVGLAETLGQKDIFLYPNPANNSITLDFNGFGFNSLSVNNNFGQKINCDYKVGTSKVEIDTSTLSSGLYSVNISVDEKLFYIKMLVQH